MSIRIITDTPSDIMLPEAKEMGIEIVPLKIMFGDKVYRETVDISIDEFYKKLESSKEFPTTSQPSPEDYLPLYLDAKEKGDDVVVLALSGGLSGTYQSASIAKGIAEYDKIHVVDTRSAIVGQRLIVEEAVKLRDKGASANEIVEFVEDIKSRVTIWGIIDTLEYLYRGGRLSKASSIVGTLLRLKPVITLDDGKIALLSKARGIQASIDKTMALIDENGGIDKSAPMVFGYIQQRENALELQKQVCEKYGITESKCVPIGGVIGSHIGPGGFTVGYLRKKQ